jgi:putative DNA primase/helicase
MSKIPYRAVDGRRASSTNPDDWVSFDRAWETFVFSLHYVGLGFVFAPDGGVCGIDLDHVISDGRCESWAEDAVRAFGSYAELSISGQGLHILCRGAIPGGKGRRRGQVELYDRGRYFVMSGHPYGEPRPLREAQNAINMLLAWMDERKRPTPVNISRPGRTIPDDRELLRRAALSKNGLKFARLWRGDTSDYGGDHSRADIALLSMLLFWTQGDEDRADSLFRMSGLSRDKWEHRDDYRERCFGFLRRGGFVE